MLRGEALSTVAGRLKFPVVLPREGVVAGRLAETVRPAGLLSATDEEGLAAVTLFPLVPGAVLATVLL